MTKQTFILLTICCFMMIAALEAQMLAPCVFRSPTDGNTYDLTPLRNLAPFQVRKAYDTNWRYTVGICNGVGTINNNLCGLGPATTSAVIGGFKAIEEWTNQLDANAQGTSCANLASNDLTDVQMEQPLTGGLVLWYLQGSPLQRYPQIRKVTKINVICDRSMTTPEFSFVNNYFTSDREIFEFTLKSVYGCGVSSSPTTRTCFGIPSDSSDVCSGHGTCSGNDTCTCITGWTGPQCNVPICFGVPAITSGVCSGNGICIAPDTCQCTANFEGNQCQTPREVRTCFGIPANDPTACSGHGSCINDNVCQCNQGWVGDQCEIAQCFGISANDSTVCSGHGTCTGPNACTCSTGWAGAECEIPSCFGIPSNNPSVCNGHGLCVNPDQCVCQVGYQPPSCASTGPIPSCFGIPATSNSVCSGHGNCTSTDTCICLPGFTGNQCQIPVTSGGRFVCFGFSSEDPRVCSGRGTCVGFDLCNCGTTGYGGRKCHVPKCFGAPAYLPGICGHGCCVAPNLCKCNLGFTGPRCNVKIC